MTSTAGRVLPGGHEAPHRDLTLGEPIRRHAARTSEVGDSEARRVEAERRELERVARWEHAMADARERWFETKRHEHLDDVMSRWEQADRIRRFVETARTSTTNDQQTLRWLAWADEHADSIEPPSTSMRFPTFDEPTRRDLEPFLGGLNAYRP